MIHRRHQPAVPAPHPAAGVASASLFACASLGEVTQDRTSCIGCTGTDLKIFRCGVYGICTVGWRGEGVPAWCRPECPGFSTGEG
jgi:hypothetical protein